MDVVGSEGGVLGTDEFFDVVDVSSDISRRRVAFLVEEPSQTVGGNHAASLGDSFDDVIGRISR